MFNKSDEEILERLKSIYTKEDLADLLEITYKSLCYFAYSRKAFYTDFSVPKRKGGNRVISVPCPCLKSIQHKILHILELMYNPKKQVYGFVKNKDHKANAQAHVARNELLSIDLEDFFKQLHFARVKGLLEAAPYYWGSEASHALANLVCCNGVLPQGAPTSPILSNMICASFDYAMYKYASKHKLTYTRYADDITLSSSRSTIAKSIIRYAAGNIEIVDEDLLRLFSKHNFVINKNKTKYTRPYHKQMVTGVVVNEFPNVSRHYIKNIRSILHHCKYDGIYETAKEYIRNEHITRYYNHVDNPVLKEEIESWFKKVIIGKVNYIRYVKNNHVGTFYQLAVSVNEVFRDKIYDLSGFYATKDIANNVFVIENEDASVQGSAFYVPSLGVFTSYHVVNSIDTKMYLYTEDGYRTKEPILELVFDSQRDKASKDIDYILYGVSITGERIKKIESGDSDRLDIGDRIVMIGYPVHTTGSYTLINTEIVKKQKHLGEMSYDVKDIIQHGFSGGVVLNENNEVVGIVKSGVASLEEVSSENGTDARCGFVPINIVKNDIDNYT